MERVSLKHRCAILIFLGLWLISGTLTFGFADPFMQISDLISGVLLSIFGWGLRRRATRAILWGTVLVGLWLQCAPLIFWAKESSLYLNDTLVGCGALLAGLGIAPLPGEREDLGQEVPPRFPSNPSSWPSRAFIALIAFVCWMISRYLASYQMGFMDTVWSPSFLPGTQQVLNSKISKAFPISDAGLGAAAYALEAISACLGGQSRWRTAPWAVLVYGVLVIPVSLVSIILVILQPLSVGFWCFLCLATAALMLFSIPFAIQEVAASLLFLRSSPKGLLWKRLVHGGFCEEASEQNILPVDAPLSIIQSAICSGVSFPWNAIASIGVGLFLMCIPALFPLNEPALISDPIIGALAIAAAVLSFSQWLRPLRFMNLCLGAIPLGIALWTEQGAVFLVHGVAGSLLVALCFDLSDTRRPRP